jgi:hypothetical protein
MSSTQDFDIFDESMYDPSLSIDATNDTAVVAANTTDEMSVSSTDLSDSQEITLILLQMFSATLSLIGSSVIVFKILRSLHRKQPSTPYDRIILGLSMCDIVASCTYAVSPFLLPKDTSNRIWAFGNETSCTWLGFLAQLSLFWAIWYNCILSFYYLLTVRFRVKREVFTKKYELWMHLTGAIFFPLTSLIGLVGNWYSEMRYNMLCWVGEVPKGCEGCWGVLVAYVFGAPSTIFTLLAVVINNIVIYIFVRRNLHSSPPSSTAGSSEIDLTEVKDSSAISSPQRLSKQNRLRKEAAVQGFLYVTTFMLTFLPSFVIQVLEGMVEYGAENLQQIFPLLVFNSIFMPLQGFFNVFIYVRPSYNRFREAHPSESRLSILKQSLFDPNIPRVSVVATSGRSDDLKRARDKYSESKKKFSNFSLSLELVVEEDGSTGEKDELDIEVDSSTEEKDEQDICKNISSTKIDSTESFRLHRRDGEDQHS